jgi:hypothetical protein
MNPISATSFSMTDVPQACAENVEPTVVENLTEILQARQRCKDVLLLLLAEAAVLAVLGAVSVYLFNKKDTIRTLWVK